MRTTTSSAAAKPKKGGTLKAGLSGGGPTDTVDGQKGVDNVDFSRIVSLYDALVVWDLNAKPKYSLATEILPNKDATLWTIKLRPDVTFHNGKPLTAEDVIYSYQRVVSGDLGGASSLAPCDVKHMKAVNKHEVQIPCFTPFATFVESIIGYYYYLSIVPVGYPGKPAKWTGTGPFKYQSFTPGEVSTFVRNENYWDHPYPYIDTLVIEEPADEGAQVSGLLSGEYDCVDLLDASSIASVRSQGGNILISNAGGMTPITMRVDVAPFNDVNVRQALRLCVNRPEMLSLVFSGHGKIANDVFSPFDPLYDNSIPQRHQDIDHAKFLLKKAGFDKSHPLKFTMFTGEIAQGTERMAQVFAQQCSAAGVTVTIRDEAANFYGPQYLHYPFAQDYWYYAAYLPQVSEATLYNSPFNETHFASNANTQETTVRPKHPLPAGGVGERYINLYNQAISTQNLSLRKELAHELQMIDYNYGGYIIPYFPPVIDGYSKQVGGVQPSLTGLSLGNYSFQQMWKI
jgi:peptide/nickel transport system substrate-binding protein